MKSNIQYKKKNNKEKLTRLSCDTICVRVRFARITNPLPESPPAGGWGGGGGTLELFFSLLAQHFVLHVYSSIGLGGTWDPTSTPGKINWRAKKKPHTPEFARICQNFARVCPNFYIGKTPFFLGGALPSRPVRLCVTRSHERRSAGHQPSCLVLSIIVYMEISLTSLLITEKVKSILIFFLSRTTYSWILKTMW